MPFKRSVWILDIYDFLKHLESVLPRCAHRFPWVLDATPIDQNYPWTATQHFRTSTAQRDVWIDWVVRRQLAEVYYIEQFRVESQPEFEALLNYLREYEDFERQVRYYFYFPTILGDIHTHAIYRQSSWLYVELTFDTNQQPR